MKELKEFTKEKFITERTRIISEMLDNLNEHGIYSTTKCFNELDKLYDRITALINDNYVPKEFVEWMLKNAAYSDVPAKEFTSKWNVITEDNTWVYFTTDEAIQYWKTNIRDK